MSLSSIIFLLLLVKYSNIESPTMIVLTCLVVVASILLLVAYYLTSFFGFHRKTDVAITKPKVIDDKKMVVEPMQVDKPPVTQESNTIEPKGEKSVEPNDNSSNTKEMETPPLVFLQRSRPNHDDADDKLIDMARARRSVPDVGIPTELTVYKIGGKSIGKYRNWATNHRQLVDLTHMITNGLRHCHNHVTEMLGVQVVQDFIARLHQNANDILTMPINVILSTVTMLGHFLLLSTTVTDNEARKKAMDLIERWVTSPRQLADKRRVSSASDIVQLTGPWLLLKYHMEPYRVFEKLVLESEDFLFAREILRMKEKTQLGEQGRHMDGSYFDGNGMLSFDTLSRLADPNVAYVFGLVVIDGDPTVKAKPDILWAQVNDTISHPAVDKGLFGVNVFKDPDSYTIHTNHNAPYGLRVMPLCKYLRCFTETHHFSVRGLSSRYPFFNRQTMPDNSAQYAVQYRNVLTRASSAPIVTFPNLGLIVAATGNNEPVRMQWQEPSVVRYPREARSVVLKYRQFGILYQTYRIPEFGEYRVNELITVNANLNRLDDLLELENLSSNERYDFYGDRMMSWPTQPMSTSRYLTNIDFSDNDTVKTSTIGVTSPFPKFPIVVHPNIELRLYNDNYVVLYEGDKPRVCCPFECETETNVIKLPEVDVTFEFDREENQWLSTK